jgi:hypothetical protein
MCKELIQTANEISIFFSEHKRFNFHITVLQEILKELFFDVALVLGPL